MADFNSAVNYVLSNEGGFVDNPKDTGGATNFGISLRTLRDFPNETLRKYGFMKAGDELTVEDVKEMTVDQAKLIYRGQFWEAISGEKIEAQILATYLLDMAVLHGTAAAIKLAQRGSWAVYHKMEFIKADGVLGQKTLQVLNELGASFIPILIAMRASYCRLLVEINLKDKEFLNGWLERCYRI